MGSIANHQERLREHEEGLARAIAVGAEQHPVTIGFHTSAGACELLELTLHKKGILQIGKVLKHEWFKRPKIGQKILPLAERMIGLDFPEKKNAYELLYQIEEHRNNLIYGKSTLAEIDAVINAFRKLQELLRIEE